jgi:UPF0755 protein
MKKLGFILVPIATFLILFSVWKYFGPPGDSKQTQVFVVPQDIGSFNTARTLTDQKLIKSASVFSFLLNNFVKDSAVRPGGYKLSQSMNVWQVVKKITGKADLVWFRTSVCIRKEQVGEQLADLLGWNDTQLNDWNFIYKNTNPEYFEGVYYPDTYLIPVDETPAQVAQRYINNFNGKIAPLMTQFSAKNMKWTTGLKIASLIARESGGVNDVKIISGIIWNRLNKGMPLQIDSTMQYTLGKNANGKWWGSIDINQKKSDSPYNSYLNKGLPPTPICSPNIDAIEAAVSPADTDCLYYLHDVYKEIHCAKTYQEHLNNIKKYLSY